MKKSTSITFSIMFLFAHISFGQLCTGGGAPATATLNLDGLNSVDEFDDDDNARGTLTVGFAGDVVAIQLTGVNLTTTGGSWCEEAVIEIADERNSFNFADIFPSLQGAASPCADLPYTELVDLVATGNEFPTIGTTVYWELWETVDDVTDDTDATYSAGTVTVYVCPTGEALPLELKSFLGKAEFTSNMLVWETFSEKNVQWHVVERSVDGVKWTEIGKKAGQMNSSTSLKYELEDRAPLAKAYYRLRSVDMDGKESLSNSILLTRKGEYFGITDAFPSPTKDQVTVQFSSLTEENVTIRVMDFTGRLVLEQQYAADNGINEVPVRLVDLQSGVYLVSISNATSTAEPMRIVKE